MPRRRMLTSLVTGLVLLLLAPSLAPRALAEEITFLTDHLAIETADGDVHRFSVELALTPQQRARGLMYREEMAADAGMLFLFEREAPRSFWMKNTYLPLDILFLDRHGRIVAITADTVPLSEAPILSGLPAIGVLELNAGTAAGLGIGPGDRVLHRAFGS